MERRQVRLVSPIYFDLLEKNAAGFSRLCGEGDSESKKSAERNVELRRKKKKMMGKKCQ